MTGYEIIKNMPKQELAANLETSDIFATVLKNTDKEHLPEIDFCPSNFLWSRPCNDKTYSCVRCRKEFLENEIPM